MGGYIANFTVYTMAMAGLICFAVFVYKKVMDGTFRGNGSKYLSVEESMSLTPRKTLHVVRAGNEKFLIASDVDRTTLISKLGADININDIQMMPQAESFMQNIPAPNVQPPQSMETHSEPRTVQQAPRQRVHLEPVKPKVKHISKGMDKRENIQMKGNTVELDFSPVNHGFSTMKEMAKKINEL